MVGLRVVLDQEYKLYCQATRGRVLVINGMEKVVVAVVEGVSAQSL
jgi:hypothetical protein